MCTFLVCLEYLVRVLSIPSVLCWSIPSFYFIDYICLLRSIPSFFFLEYSLLSFLFSIGVFSPYLSQEFSLLFTFVCFFFLASFLVVLFSGFFIWLLYFSPVYLNVAVFLLCLNIFVKFFGGKISNLRSIFIIMFSL